MSTNTRVFWFELAAGAEFVDKVDNVDNRF
jgi:hypothetical protein